MSSLGIRTTENERRGGILIVLLLLVSAAAVAIGLLWSTLATRSDTVDAGPRTLWAAQAADHYRYTLQVGCFCILEMVRPVTIEVANGELVAATYADDGTPADAALFERFASVEKLYAVIDEAAAQEPAQLDVTYDEAFGVPTQISIDISEMMADEELYLTVTDFEMLP